MSKQYTLAGGRVIEDFVPHDFGGPALREFLSERRGSTWWDFSVSSDVRKIPGLSQARYKRIFHSLYRTESNPAVNALRLILEMHAPRGTEQFGLVCAACRFGNWPCDTFLAIEEEHDAALPYNDPDDDYSVDEDLRE